MLLAHLAAVEHHLLSISRIPANAGHTLHRGTPREAFIKGFLTGHLSALAAVGTGEIIDALSRPREPRSQFDIVIYRSDMPRIDLGGGLNAFLSESVIATIEVKSHLTKDELAAAVRSAAKAKKLLRNSRNTGGDYAPAGILSYAVAYEGPVQIETVLRWLIEVEKEQGLNTGSMDGIFVLGRGSIVFDNMNLFGHGSIGYEPIDSKDQNLFWLFLLLTEATSNITAQRPDLLPYFARAFEIPADGNER